MKEEIKIAKFGGGVLKDPTSFSQLLKIVKEEKPGIIVVSAIGKTTNALKDLTEGYFSGDKNLVNDALLRVQKINLSVIDVIFKSEEEKTFMLNRFNEHVSFLEKIISREPCNSLLPMVMDMVLSQGEIISSEIVSYYLKYNKFDNNLISASHFIATDPSFGSANVLKDVSIEKLKICFFNKSSWFEKPIVIQGFIGHTDMELGEIHFSGPTTLGREGSDYTAGLLGNMFTKLNIPYLKVKEVVLWKDVNGLANRNPKDGKGELRYYSSMNYSKCEEMIRHGGPAEGLVHLKTVAEVSEVNVPLLVKNFWKPNLKGTKIWDKPNIKK